MYKMNVILILILNLLYNKNRIIKINLLIKLTNYKLL